MWKDARRRLHTAACSPCESNRVPCSSSGTTPTSGRNRCRSALLEFRPLGRSHKSALSGSHTMSTGATYSFHSCLSFPLPKTSGPGAETVIAVHGKDDNLCCGICVHPMMAAEQRPPMLRCATADCTSSPLPLHKSGGHKGPPSSAVHAASVAAGLGHAAWQAAGQAVQSRL